MLKPIKNNVVIDPTDVLRKTKSGLTLPDREKRASEGVVIAVGPEAKIIKVKDYVFFSEFVVNGREIKQDNKLYIVLKEDDILAIQ